MTTRRMYAPLISYCEHGCVVELGKPREQAIPLDNILRPAPPWLVRCSIARLTVNRTPKAVARAVCTSYFSSHYGRREVDRAGRAPPALKPKKRARDKPLRSAHSTAPAFLARSHWTLWVDHGDSCCGQVRGLSYAVPPSRNITNIIEECVSSKIRATGGSAPRVA